ncbi:helix-turn-helix transcriptional regulator [Enterococcus faecium]|uniref:helix-turn-helix transcriptional regulator n=1 Tax=Enterococcus faecium TaxID=1352 RepID=UPI003CE4DFD8
MNNLYVLRKKYHVSQSELAYYVGANRMSISRIETNQQIPSLELAYKIACFFQVSTDDLFFSSNFVADKLPLKTKEQLLYEFVMEEGNRINFNDKWHNQDERKKELERISSLKLIMTSEKVIG